MADTLTICGVSYSVSFSKGTCDGPCLTLTSPTASGASYTAVRESCGPNYAVFAIGNPAVCTGDPACGGPAANLLRLKVQWVSCLWDGPGWYCVRDCGGAGACTATELLEGDQYDASIEICSGPYADEATAGAACPGPFNGPCYLPTPPRWMKLTITTSACFTGTWYLPRVPQAEGSPTCVYQIAGNTTDSLLTLVANGGSMQFRTYEPGGSPLFGNRFWNGAWDGVASTFDVTGAGVVAFSCGDAVQAAQPVITITPVP
ncbi:MAG TPA: hypothetical protein VGE74_01535 [Gemmata sp.]